MQDVKIIDITLHRVWILWLKQCYLHFQGQSHLIWRRMRSIVGLRSNRLPCGEWMMHCRWFEWERKGTWVFISCTLVYIPLYSISKQRTPWAHTIDPAMGQQGQRNAYICNRLSNQSNWSGRHLTGHMSLWMTTWWKHRRTQTISSYWSSWMTRITRRWRRVSYDDNMKSLQYGIGAGSSDKKSIRRTMQVFGQVIKVDLCVSWMDNVV